MNLKYSIFFWFVWIKSTKNYLQLFCGCYFYCFCEKCKTTDKAFILQSGNNCNMAQEGKLVSDSQNNSIIILFDVILNILLGYKPPLWYLSPQPAAYDLLPVAILTHSLQYKQVIIKKLLQGWDVYTLLFKPVAKVSLGRRNCFLRNV